MFDLYFPINICNWIIDFLLHRPQVVRIGDIVSSSIILNTGAPQGCPLSPKLYSIFTFDCQSKSHDSLVIKFADDTTVTGFINDNNEEEFRNQIDWVVAWCKRNNLLLNVDKTKEMVVDFRRVEDPPPPLSIDGQIVERVESFKFLGTWVSNRITWDINSSHIISKARQRLYFLRKLRSFQVSRDTLVNFYRCIIESTLTQCILVWFDRVSRADLNKLNAVVRSAEKIIGVKLTPLELIYENRMLSKLNKILGEDTHPSRQYFEFLPHGRRLRAFRGSVRFVNSCFPQAIKYFNNTRVRRNTY